MVEGSLLPSEAHKASGLSESIYDYINALGVASAEEMTFKQKAGLVTKTLKEQAIAFATSGAGIATFVAVGLFALIKAIDYYNKAADRARENLSKLKEEFNDNATQITDIDGQLERIKERMSELQGKTLSLTEREEYENLRKENAELDRRKSILEAINEAKKEEIALGFLDVMNKDLNRRDVVDNGWDVVGGSDNSQGATEQQDIRYVTEKEYIEQQFDEYHATLDAMYALDEKYQDDKGNEQYKKQRERLERNNAEISSYLADKIKQFSEDATGLSYFENPDNEYKRAVNEWLDYYNDAVDRYNIMTGKDNAKENAFTRLITGPYDEVTEKLKELGDQGKVTADDLSSPEYDSFINHLIQIGFIADKTPQSLTYVAAAFNTFTKAANTAGKSSHTFAGALTASSEKIDSMQEKISSLSDAFTKLHDGTLTASEVVDLIQQFPELASYVDMTAEGFGNLEDGLKKVLRHVPDELIKELEKFKETEEMTQDQADALDDFIGYLKDIPSDTISDLSEEFGILGDAINGAKKNLTELEKKLSEPDYDANYEARVKYIKQLKELIKNGEIGSKEYQHLVEYFGMEGMSSDQVSKEVNRIDDWFTEGSTGIKKFLKHIQELNKSGKIDPELISFDGSALEYDVSRLDEIAYALGISRDILVDMLQKLKMYSPSDRSVQSIFDELSFAGIVKKDASGQFIASLEDIMAYMNMTEAEARSLIHQMGAIGQTDLKTELEKLGEGGNVDLTVRPVIDSSALAAAGWDVGAGDIATVFSSTFSNVDGTVAINFTPILADQNGNFVRVLSEDELARYAEDVINGVHDDYLNLQIGAAFEGEDAIAEAKRVAERISEIHDQYYNDDWITSSEDEAIQKSAATEAIQAWEGFADASKKNSQEVANLVLLLSDLGMSAIDATKFAGGSVEEIKQNFSTMVKPLLESLGWAQEEIDALYAKLTNVPEPTGPKEATKEITLIVNGESFDVAIGKSGELKTAIKEVPESVPITVKLDGAEFALSELGGIDGLLEEIELHRYQKVTIEYETIGDPPQKFATGTSYAHKGAALLGDEYSPTGSPKPELVVGEDGAYIAGLDGPEMGYLNEGDRVYTADQTKKILRGAKSKRKNLIPAHRKGINNDPSMVAFDGSTVVIGRPDIVVSKEPSGPIMNKMELDKWIKGKHGGSGGATPQNKEDLKKAFEEAYKEHQHLVAMEQETDQEYFDWLDSAYKDAYEKGLIDLDDYRKYEEEVYDGRKDLFQDYLNDIEHKISILEREEGNEDKIISMYKEMMSAIEAEIASAKERGLDENSDYIQDLQNQYYSYADEIISIEEEIAEKREEVTEDAKDAVEDLVDFRIKMIEQEIKTEKDALNDKLDDLKDYYDEQKKMLQDQYDEEDYLEEQREKRKAKSDIEAELASLERDDSAWAQKRKLELQEELASAQKDLNDFEKDHARQEAEDLLDEMYEKQAAEIESQIDELEQKLNDPNAIYNQALSDIKNNTADLYQEMVEYNNRFGDGNPETVKEMWDEAYASLKEYMDLFGEAYQGIMIASSGSSSVEGYASGTSSATPGIKRVWENGSEYIFQSSDGNRYKMFTGGEKVLNADATNFLYKFATSGGEFLTNLFKDFFGSANLGNIVKPMQAIQLTTGDIIIQGNADQRTVSEIRRAQRDNIEHVLKEFNRLNK